jgi:serine/threonine protein kinase
MQPDANLPRPHAEGPDDAGPPVPDWLLGYEEALRRGEAVDSESWLRQHPEGEGTRGELWALDQLYAAVRTVAEDSRLDALPTLDQPAGPPPARQLGVYRLIRLLGKGGMGQVYEAEDEGLERRVALKTLPAGQAGGEALRRFRRERRSVGRLRHRNIVDAFYADSADGVEYFVMELVEGQNLADVVRARGPLPVADAGRVAQQVAEALAYAHDQGILHRDVKPSNLMLTADGTVKVVDFGLARPLGQDPNADDVTHTGQAMGTLDYMAPEQWNDAKTVGAGADLYSLGCTLYFLLAGHAPFSDFEQKRRAHTEREPPPIGRDLPAGLAAVLQRLLAKKPENRYARAAEVATALAALESRLQPVFEGKTQAEAGTPTPAPVLDEPPVQVSTISTAPYDAAPLEPSVPIPAQAAPAGSRFSRARWLPVLAGVAAVVALGVGIAVWWSHRDRAGGGLSSQREALQSTRAPVEGAAALEVLRLKHYPRDLNPAGDFRSLLPFTGASIVRHRDAMRVEVTFSQRVYPYLIALNPDGSVQLLHPEGVANAPGTQFVLPPDLKDTPELDQVGFQAFVLVAARQPLPPFDQWQPRLDVGAWKQAEPPVPWQFDGRELNPLPGGQRTGKVAVGPQPLAEVCRRLQAVEGVGGVQAIGFSVLPRE